MNISVHSFSGMSPRLDEHLLANAQSAYSINAKTDRGTLTCWDDDLTIKTLEGSGSNYQSLFLYERMPDRTDQWLFWDTPVNIVKGPVYNDKFNRMFLTFPTGNARCFDSTILPADAVTANDSNTYPLGLPTPNAPTMAPVEVPAEVKDSRAYVITYAREWSEQTKLDESQSGLPAKTAEDKAYIDVDFSTEVNITGIDDPSIERPDVNRIGIYRSATGTKLTKFQLVTIFNIADAKAGSVENVTFVDGKFNYLDKLKDDALGEELISRDWTPPQTALTGLVSVSNGVLAGYVGNDVYLSEPYQPHAWPEKYRVTVDEPIVGLGTFGNFVVVLTKGRPVLLGVQDPAAVYTQPLGLDAPCMSTRSIVSTDKGVYYSGPTGIVSITSQEASVMSLAILDRFQWADLRPETVVMSIFDDKLFCAYDPKDRPKEAFLLNVAEQYSALTYVDVIPEAFYVDHSKGDLYFIKEYAGETCILRKWASSEFGKKLFVWKSKRYTSTQGPTNMSAAKVSSYPPSEEELKKFDEARAAYKEAFENLDLQGGFNEHLVNAQGINADAFSQLREKLKDWYTVVFTLIVDGTEIYTYHVRDNKPFRLPSGIVGDDFQFIITGNKPVYGVDIAPSMRELSQVTAAGSNYAMMRALV